MIFALFYFGITIFLSPPPIGTPPGAVPPEPLTGSFKSAEKATAKTPVVIDLALSKAIVSARVYWRFAVDPPSTVKISTFLSKEPVAMSLESGEKVAFKTRLDEGRVYFTLGIGAAAARHVMALRRMSRTILALKVKGTWPWLLYKPVGSKSP